MCCFCNLASKSTFSNMNFLTTAKSLKYIFVLATFIAFVNLSKAQYCPTVSNNNIKLCYQLGGGIAFDFQCSETNGSTTIALTVQSITGGNPPYTVTSVSDSNGRVSETKVLLGGGFIYSFTLDDFQNDRVNFTVRDQANRTANLDPNILNQISNNLFSGNCNVVNPYFLVLDNDTSVESGESKAFSALECVLLDKTFQVAKNADFEANVDPNLIIRPE